MFSKLTLFTFTTLLLFASTKVEACGMGYTGQDVGLLLGLAVGAAITAPVWVPLYYIGKGLKLTGKAISQGVKNVAGPHPQETFNEFGAVNSNEPTTPEQQQEFWQKRLQSDELKEYFLKTEKDPNVSNLLACALHFELAGDLTSARNFLRRSIEAAKKDPKWETDVQVLPLVALAEHQQALILFRIQFYGQAVFHMQECKRILNDKLGGAGSPTTAKDDDKADHSVEILSVETVSKELAWFKVYKCLYDESSYGDDFAVGGVARSADLRQAAAELCAFADAPNLPQDANKYDVAVEAAIAVFYQYADQFSYQWSSDPDDDKKRTADEIKAEREACVKAFSEVVLPRFRKALAGIVALKKIDPTAKKELLGWTNYYLSRSYYLLLDEKSAGVHYDQAKKYLKESDISFRRSVCEEIVRRCIESTPEQLREQNYSVYEQLSEATLILHPVQITPDLSGTNPHLWKPKYFHRPSFCGKCKEYIHSKENKEGCFICEACSVRVHKHCKEALGDIAACAARNHGNMQNHQHVLRKKNLGKPAVCHYCIELIKNPFGVFSCESCNLAFHSECAKEKMTNAIVIEEEEK